MKMIAHPSPNFGNRKGQAITTLVIHYTGMQTAKAALDRLCDPKAEVSAHYMIDEDGIVYALVDEGQRAWHAGVSFWRGERDINSCSIGIELVNPGHEFGLVTYGPAQMDSLVELASGIVTRFTIDPRNVVGHSDIAPMRKLDPGELFDWQRLAAQGIGMWPRANGPMTEASNLAEYGYDTSDLAAAITAFQRHFRPLRIDGVWDDECGALLGGLIRPCV